MYCKKCGYQIDEDSKFCKCCGSSLEEFVHTYTGQGPKSETDVHVKSFIHTQSAKSNRKSTIANEVVANLKMICIAIALWIAYIIGFSLIHANDTKTMDENSWYGESCYDPPMLMGSWEMYWEKIYAQKVLILIEEKYSKHPRSTEQLASSVEYNIIPSLSADNALKDAEEVAKVKRIPKAELEMLKNEAKSEAQRAREDFWMVIDGYRKNGFEDDLHNNMIWAAIITLSLTVLGRYIIKFGKWVIENKT